MCGIFDVYQNGKAQKINITQLEQATNTLRQRGPDMELVKKEWVDILR